MEKVCIYPKEAAQFLQISERQAQRLFQNIRAELRKKKHQYITIKEFCDHTGIDENLLPRK